MDVRDETMDGVTVVSLAGRLDRNTAGDVQSHLVDRIADGGSRLLVDGSGLDYVSSAGLRVFLIAAKKLDAVGGKLLICGLNPDVYAVFEATGFTKILAILPTREDALAAP